MGSNFALGGRAVSKYLSVKYRDELSFHNCLPLDDIIICKGVLAPESFTPVITAVQNLQRKIKGRKLSLHMTKLTKVLVSVCSTFNLLSCVVQ